MQSPADNKKKALLLNLFLFYILYFALAITERQLVRQGFLGFKLPIKLNILETLAGLVLGSILVVGLSLLLRKKAWIVRLLITGTLVLGSVYLNYFLFRFYFPPYSITPPGDLQYLGEERWGHDYAYSMYSSMYNKYYLQTIMINPDIENLDEFSRVERFGVYLKESRQAPLSISPEQFSYLEETLGDKYLSIAQDGIEYRLYDVDPPGVVYLTRYEELILFLPLNFPTE